MTVNNISDWIMDFRRPEIFWYVKRLTGNDTLAVDKGDAGARINRKFLFGMFPSLFKPKAENPDVRFPLYIDSHDDLRTGRAVWYNDKLRGGTTDEARLTDFGGSPSALLDPESTGALTIFAFVLNEAKIAKEVHVWVCETVLEEEVAEYWVGWPVESGRQFIYSYNHGSSLVSA